MNFIEFRNRFLSLACFTTNQVYATYPEFNRNTLGNRVRQGYLVRLRQGYYDFPAKWTGIKNAVELKAEVKKRLKNTDLKTKASDFEHLLFNKENTRRILRFEEFLEENIL